MPTTRTCARSLRGSFPSVRDLDDVIQESYLRIWRRQLGEPIRSGKTFLFQVAKRLAIDLLRRTRAAPFETVPEISSLSVMQDSPTADEVAAKNEELDLLYEAIDSLPARCQEILILQRKIQPSLAKGDRPQARRGGADGRDPDLLPRPRAMHQVFRRNGCVEGRAR